MTDHVDDNYDPDNPDNYADVGEMVRQVTGDDPDTPHYDDAEEEITVETEKEDGAT